MCAQCTARMPVEVRRTLDSCNPSIWEVERHLQLCGMCMSRSVWATREPVSREKRTGRRKRGEQTLSGKSPKSKLLSEKSSTMIYWDALASKNTPPLLGMGGLGLPAPLLSECTVGRGKSKVTKASAAVTDDAEQ